MFAPSAERRPVLSRRQKAVALVLAILNLWLGAVVAQEYAALVDVSPPPVASSPAAAAAAPARDDFSLPPLDALKEVTERPLFARNRRPFVAAANAAPGNAATFLLAGVTIAGEKRVALIQHGPPPSIARLSEGETIEGWTVRRIADDRVVLRNGAAEYTIPLYKAPRP